MILKVALFIFYLNDELAKFVFTASFLTFMLLAKMQTKNNTDFKSHRNYLFTYLAGQGFVALQDV